MTKQLPRSTKVKNFLEKHPNSTRQQIVEGVRGDKKSILTTIYALTNENKILKDDKGCYTVNENYHPKNSSTKPKQKKITAKIEKEPQQQNLPIEIPNNVVSALKGIEQLTIDRQICVQTLKDIKDLVDKALFQLIEQK